MRRIAALTALLLATACSGMEVETTQDASTASPAATPDGTSADPTPETTETPPPAETQDEDVAAPDDDAAPADEVPADGDVLSVVRPALRAGVWEVGDAGTVEFKITEDGQLELVDVVAADGWTVTDQEVAPGEIEVDFERGEVEYEIEIELEGSVLEVEIDQDIDPAQPGRYEIGDAGVVEFAVDGGQLVLVDASAADGWNLIVEEEAADEIELELRRGDVTWDADIELDDDVVEVEIDFEIEGPLAG